MTQGSLTQQAKAISAKSGGVKGTIDSVNQVLKDVNDPSVGANQAINEIITIFKPK